MKQPSRRDCALLALAFILCCLSISAIAAPQAEAGYVDATLCSECHAKIAESYLQTGMGRSLFRLQPASVVEDFHKKNSFYHKASDRYYTMYEQDGKYYLRRHQIGSGGGQTNVVEREIQYVLGSGNRARGYLYRRTDGALMQLPVSWYSEEGGHWGMAPGYSRPDQVDFRRQLDDECIFCHARYPEIEPGTVPGAIDCQRCHGPGRDHIGAVRRGEPAGSIVNPARLNADRQLEICLQCHLESTSRPLPYALRRYGRGWFSYRPGEPLEDYILHFDHAPGTGRDDKFEVVSAAYRLRKSACFRKSGGAIVCTTCHDPHSVRRYAGACERCHAESLAKLVARNRHPDAGECVACHMPKRRAEDAVHVVMTDHYIQRKPAPDLLAPLDAARETGRVYRGEVVLYYPPRLPAGPETELYVAVAQVKDQSNLKDGIRRLESAIRRYRPERAEFYFELGEAYWHAGQLDSAVRAYEAALARNPLFPPALRSLGLVLSSSGQLPRAIDALRAVSADPAALNALGEAYHREGREDQAIAVLQKAIAANPDPPEAHSNLGVALFETGDRASAEAALREAIRLRPDFAAAHNNLANLLNAADRFPEAQYHFRKAFEIDRGYAAARLNYAVALAQHRMFGEAQAQLEAALGLGSDPAEVENYLGAVLAAKGDREGAIEQYNRAIQRNPDYFEAHLGLGRLLSTMGRRDEAASQLRHAGRSPDPRVRNQALKALAELNRAR